VRYRKATPDDVAAIANLHADSWRNTYRGAYSDEYLDGPVFEERLAVWQKRLSSPPPNQYVVIAEDGGRIVGLACAYGEQDAELGTLLDNLHVRVDLHKSGIGKRLVSEIARWCVARYPQSPLYLGVLEQNLNAQQFYKRLGAHDVRGEIARSPSGDAVPSRIYAWTREQVTDLASESLGTGTETG
jgi:GNAT superfamily N-acetyltransferase